MSRKSTKIALAIGFTLLVVVLAGIFLLPRAESFINEQVSRALGSLDSSVYGITGLHVTYEYAELSSMDHITLHEVGLYKQTEPAPGAPSGEKGKDKRNIIVIRDLKVRFNLWGFLVGKPQDVLRQIDLQGLSIAFKLPEDAEPLNKIVNYIFFEPIVQVPALLLNIEDFRISLVSSAPYVPSVNANASANTHTSTKTQDFAKILSGLGSNYSISVFMPRFQTSLLTGGMDFVMPEVHLSGRLASVYSSLDPEIRSVVGSESFGSTLKSLHVSISPDFSQIDLAGRIAANMGKVSLREHGLTLKKEGASLKMGLKHGKGLEVKGEYRGGELEVGVRLAGYRPGDGIAVSDGVVKEILGLRYSGEVKVRYGGGGLGYRGDVEVEAPEGAVVGGVKVGGVKAQVAGEGDGKGLRGVKVEVGSGGGIVKGVEYRGDIGYEGMDLEGVLGITGEGGVLVGEVRGSKGVYRYEGGEQALGGVEIGHFGVDMGFVGGRYTVGFDVGIGRGEVGGRVAVGEGGRYEGRVEVGKVAWGDVAKVLEVYGVKVGIGDEVRGELNGGIGFSGGGGEVLSWSGDDLGVQVSVGGVEVGVTGGICGEGGRYDTEGLVVKVGGEEVGVRGKGSYEGGISFEGEVGYKGKWYGVQVGYRGGEVRVRGDYGLEAELRLGDGVAGKLKAEGISVGVGVGTVRADIGLGGYYRADGEWGIEEGDVRVRYEAGGGYTEAGLKGLTGSGGKLRAQEVRVAGPGYAYTGTLEVDLGSLAGKPLIEATGQFQNADARSGVLSVALRYSDKIVDAKAAINEFPLSQLLGADVSGTVKGTLEAKGELSSTMLESGKLNVGTLPLVTLNLDLVSAFYKKTPLDGTLNGRLANGILELSIPGIEYAGTSIDDVQLTASLLDGKLGLKGRLKTGLGQNPIEASLVLDGLLHSPNGIANSTFNISKYSAEFNGKFQNIRYGETLTDTWAFSGKYEAGDFTFVGGQDAMRVSLNKNGSFEAKLGGSMPIKAAIRGQLSNQSIDARVDDISLNLSTLNPFLSSQDFAIEAGVMQGNLIVSGTFANPTLDGKLYLKDGVFRTGLGQFGKIGPLNSSINIADNLIVVPDSFVPLGKGGVNLSAQANFEQWALIDPKIKVKTLEDSELLVTTSLGPVNLDKVLAKLDLDLSFENGLLSVGGKVQLLEGQVSTNLQALAGINTTSAAATVSAAESPNVVSEPLQFHADVAITFGKKLELYFPDRNIPVLHGFLDPSSKLQFGYDSESQYYTLDGQVDFRSGYFFYYLRNFFIRSASIYFNEDSTRFNPLFSIEAELRESSGSYGLVRVALSADRTPFDNMHFRLSSQPAMTEAQLMAFISGGVLSTNTDRSLNLVETAIASSEFLPQLRFLSSFEQNIQRALGLDILLLRTTFIQRWLMDITKPVGIPLATDPLAHYLNQTSLFMGKYVTDSTFLYGNFVFRENPLVSSSRLRLDSEFGVELETPFGLMNWSILPTYQNGKLDIGQQLSLSWRYAY